MNDIIKSIEEAQLKSDITPFSVGDTVKVYAKVKEGNRERTQVFEGTVIKRQNGSNRETFTVRKSSNGIGVEKTWPLHSPIVEKIIGTNTYVLVPFSLVRAVNEKSSIIKEAKACRED